MTTADPTGAKASARGRADHVPARHRPFHRDVPAAPSRAADDELRTGSPLVADPDEVAGPTSADPVLADPVLVDPGPTPNHDPVGRVRNDAHPAPTLSPAAAAGGSAPPAAGASPVRRDDLFVFPEPVRAARRRPAVAGPTGSRTLARLAVRGARADKVRLIASLTAIVISVAFMTTTQLLTATIAASFSRSVATTYGDAALIVRAGGGVQSDLGITRPPVDSALAERVATVPGVGAVGGRVRSQVAVLDRHGQPIGGANAGPAVTALNWPTDRGSGWAVTDGRAPAGPGELVMDVRTAAAADFLLGDRVVMQTNGGVGQFQLVGLARFRGGDDYAGSSAVLLETATAQAQLLRPGAFNWIEIGLAPGADRDATQTGVARALGPDADVVTADEYAHETQSALDQLLGALRTVLTVMTAVALVVGAFIISNTFTIVVAQRSRELALLRAIGGSTRQALSSIALEALLTGALAVGVGLAVGAVLARAMAGIVTGAGGIAGDPFASAVVGGATVAVEHLEWPLGALALIVVSSLVVTVGSAWLPAWRACRVPPVDALRESTTELEPPSDRRRRIGTGSVVAGAVIVALALVDKGPQSIVFVGLGSFLGFVGTIVIGPALVERFAAVARPVEGRFTARLARRNAVRNARRTAATASALTIGVALVALFAIVVSSLKVTVTEAIDTLIGADVVVDSGTFGSTGIDPAFREQVAAIPGVERAVGIELGFATVDGTPTQVIGADLRELTRIVRVDEARGSIADLRDDEVAIDVTTAATKGWKLGSEVPSSLADAGGTPGSTPVKVGAIFDTGGVGNGFGILMSRDGFNSHFPVQQQTDNQLFVTLTDGAVAADVQQRLTGLISATYPSAKVRDLDAYKQAQSGLLDVVLSTVGALVVLAMGIAVLGIANTLALSVHERTREIGMLRAVGTTRRQVQATIRWESILFAVQGAVTGTVLGVAIAWALVRALTIQGSSLLFAMPWALLGGTVVAAVAAGLLAAQLPAVAAARLRPVEALRL